MAGKCPSCEALVTTVTIDSVDARGPKGSIFRAASYLCPYCRTILSIQIDPLAVKIDTVAAIEVVMKKMLDRR